MAFYNPKDVSVLVNGVPLKDFAKGTFVEVEFNEDRTSMDAGSKGSVTTGLSHDRTGTIKVVLQNASESNAYLDLLTAMHDQGTGYSVGVTGPFGSYMSKTSYTKTVGKLEYSGDPDSNREWEFNCEVLENVLPNALEAIGAEITNLLGNLG